MKFFIDMYSGVSDEIRHIMYGWNVLAHAHTHTVTHLHTQFVSRLVGLPI